MKTFLAVCSLALAAAGAFARPNVVVILADDLGARDLRCTGSTFYDTPNLDRMAREGMTFNQAYAACPVCSPTRAAMVTGLWPQRTGITDFIGAAQPGAWKRPTKMLPAPYAEQLEHQFTTLAAMLKSEGYATMHAGKWHLGGERYFPETHGYDVNKGGTGAGGVSGGNMYFSPYGNPRLSNGPPGEQVDERLAKECAAFIEAHRDQPFFVSFCTFDVHTPLMTKAGLKSKYEERRTSAPTDTRGKEGDRGVREVQSHPVYAGMVETMDGAAGTVLAKLDALGLASNTIVIFTSDNGGLSTSEGSPTSNRPFRGGKGWLYEGGVRVPLLVRWPGVVPAGATSEHVAITPDIMATILDACGLTPKGKLDGASFLASARGQAQPDRGPVFWHYPHYGNQGGFPGGAVRDGDWKLIERYEDGSLELYNLASDISEKTNLAAKEPARAADLRAKLDAWRADVGAKMPTLKPAASH